MQFPGEPLLHRVLAVALLLVFLGVGPCLAQDEIEFLNGSKLAGKVVQIDKPRREVEFEATIGGKTQVTRYGYKAIHAVTWKGKRYVVTKKPATPAQPLGTNTQPATRSQQEIETLIEEVGSTPPEWMAATPLDYPDTLDLDWPFPAPGPWNEKTKISDYFWGHITPNASRWKGGMRFLYFLEEHQKNNAKVHRRVCAFIGKNYFIYFQDYARALYWWRLGQVDERREGPHLAECYWRLGNEKLALSILRKSSLSPAKIKLFGDLGRTRDAIKLAEQYARAGGSPHDAYLLAGDACRLAGDYKKALKYFQMVLDEKRPARDKKYQERYENRASESIETLKLFELTDISKLADGKYTGSSLGYEGEVEVEVRVSNKRVTRIEVTRHREKRFYAAFTDVPNQIIAKQSVKGIEATSSATITAEAVINATAKALASGSEKP